MIRRAGVRHSPRGAVNLLLMLVVVSLVIVGILVALLFRSTHRAGPSNEDGQATLFVYCAAGMRIPMEAIAADYKKNHDIDIQLQYGGSNTLLSRIEVSKIGDLYLAGDASYIELAREKMLAAEVIPLATMHPVVAVREDSALKITSLKQLLDPALHIACGNPDAAAIGRTVRKLLRKSDQWATLEEQITTKGVFKPTVTDVATDVKLGAVDAGLIWNSTVAQFSGLKAFELPELQRGSVSVEITVLNSAQDPTAALKFARYVGACDRGLREFQKTGFSPVDGDLWEETPQLTFFAGSVNRRALEPIIKAFEKREGVAVTTLFNGCGILTGQMRSIRQNQTSGFPDTYMACDVYYLNTVKDWFQDAVNVSDTDIVIAVGKGNPKGIKQLSDLLKPGVRVAIGQPDQCTIGVLTRKLLESESIYDKLLKTNVVTEAPSSALLVPAIVTGAADAALAYRTDTLAEQDKIDTIAIDSTLAKAIQPFGVAKSSKHKYLDRRLFDTISRSRDAFESVGFNWRLDAGPPSNSEAAPAKTNDATKAP